MARIVGSLIAAGAITGVVGCGDNVSPTLEVGPLLELPLLVSDDPSHSFNHSCEPTVAARAGRIVVSSIQLHLPSADSYQIGTSDEFRKRIAVNVSDDGGQTFEAAVDPGLGDGTTLGDQTTDGVVRVSSDGLFFLSALRSTQDGAGVFARSADGRRWTVLASESYVDKPWLAVDEQLRQLYVGATGGYWHFDYDGNLLGAAVAPEAMGVLLANGFAAGGGVTFATAGTEDTVAPALVRWGGTAAAPETVATLDPGADADLYTVVTWSVGPLDGGTWSVRARRDQGRGSIVVRVDRAGGVFEQTLTRDEADAFFPAAAMDETGRLHVAWYDSSGPRGVLRYAHSRSVAPFADGFSDPVDIDPDACPGNGWHPGFDSNSGARRLREYIGLAVDGSDVHVAWTHSPAPPSRVYAVTLTAP